MEGRDKKWEDRGRRGGGLGGGSARRSPKKVSRMEHPVGLPSPMAAADMSAPKSAVNMMTRLERSAESQRVRPTSEEAEGPGPGSGQRRMMGAVAAARSVADQSERVRRQRQSQTSMNSRGRRARPRGRPATPVPPLGENVPGSVAPPPNPNPKPTGSSLNASAMHTARERAHAHVMPTLSRGSVFSNHLVRAFFIFEGGGKEE